MTVKNVFRPFHTRMENIIILFKKYNQWIAGVLLIISFSMMILCSRNKDQLLLNDMGFTTGRIVKVGSGYRGGADFTYEFTVNNHKYIKSSVDVSFTRGDGVKINFAYFPVIYQKNNPDNCQLLIKPSDFKAYNISYPDSLKWIEKKYFVK